MTQIVNQRKHPQECLRFFSTILRRGACCAALALLLALCTPLLHGQAANGNISGTVADASGAVIPHASVTLTDTQSKTQTHITSNGAGFFNFADIPPGTYTVTITASGFENFEATDIIMHFGESHTIPQIALPVATAKSDVTVVASQAGVIPLDTGASTTTLNTEMINSMPIQGRDAAELVKFMPGMAMNTGLGQSEFNSQTTSTNSGPIGAFAASGTQPYGGMQMTLDGANLVDIGNMGTQLANVNGDQTAEFTYMNAAFGADTPRGPTIIQVTSKGGGAGFHGDVYNYLRNWQLNANDPYVKQVDPGQDRVISHQTYPGFTLGGPVIIPGTSFNKNHDKLFFFVGYEYMLQDPAATVHQGVTPTTNMINGDFSAATLPGDQTSSTTWWPTASVPCADAPSWTGFCPSGGSKQGLFPNGQIPSTYWDSDGRALLTYLNKVNPPNIDPATHDGYNFEYLDHPPVNRWELRLRGDYNPTSNDKFAFVYTKQNEGDVNNFGVWWEPGGTVPMPSSITAETLANLYTFTYTKILSSSMTNQINAAYTYFTFPPKFNDPTAMTASTAGYTTYAPYNTLGTQAFDQLPNIVSWGSVIGSYTGSFPIVYAPPMIKAFGDAFGNKKYVESIQDNLTKLLGTHALKFGFFWDANKQTQTSGSGAYPQGIFDFDDYGENTTGNPLADVLIGAYDGFTQYASAPVHTMVYHEWALYAQDQWHLGRKLTLDYGIRFDHDGQWYPVHSPGLAVWDPATYDNTSGAPTWTGMEWHQIDSKIPQSGFVSKTVYPDARAGFAYDTKGDGKTVVRGGFGIYRWQFSEGDIDAAMNPSLNVQSINAAPSAGQIGFATLTSFSNTGTGSSWCALASSCSTGVDAIKMGENKTPYTMNWDAMVDQELPGRLMFELQYIGNHTADALFTGNGSTENFISNINRIPVGAFYGTDPLTGVNYWQQNCNAGACAAPTSSYYNGYRPYYNYGVLNEVQHGSYSNYNGMVAALQKQTGPATFIVNYTFSKVMGIRDGQSDNGNGDGTTVNPFNVRSNYGPLAYDRTHLFNAAYVLNLPQWRGQSRWARTAIGGWQLSGDTQFQSGTPIQPNTGGNINSTYETNAGGAAASNAFLLGTTAEVLTPYLSCDPRAGGGRYFNVNCFQTPSTMGVNGPSVIPYIKGPSFFVSDLGLYKSFTVHEGQQIQFRVQAFNFLNHPLPELGEGSDVDLHMTCNQSSTSAGGCDLGGANENTTTNGNAEYKASGQNRVMELALKYTF
ncbi:carboxypeptidase regulatory-like domain-containing protein [Silvibacterium sp.]|uniref:TonB-dependent receptor n=1 Tax=Silvibacterium sp. TaxID=1964179 RepID=UPI0039E2F7F3